MVEAFALLAVGTSLIGTLLSFSEFFKEQLNNLALDFPPTQCVEVASILTIFFIFLIYLFIILNLR